MMQEQLENVVIATGTVIVFIVSVTITFDFGKTKGFTGSFKRPDENSKWTESDGVIKNIKK